MKAKDSGEVGWLVLIGFVAAWDLLAPETLSHAGRRALETPGWRYLYIGAVGATALHLLDLWPEGYDPFKYALERTHHDQA